MFQEVRASIWGPEDMYDWCVLCISEERAHSVFRGNWMHCPYSHGVYGRLGETPSTSERDWTQVASAIGPIAAECWLTRLCSGSGSPKVSQLRPSNGCQIWLGFGYADLARFALRHGTLATFGPITDHKGWSDFGWDMAMQTRTSLGWVLGVGLCLQCGK